MNNVFTTVLNMSVTAAFVIAALCLARFVLQRMRAPRRISYALWAVAGFRLAVPFKLESIFSLIPRNIPEVTAPPRVYVDIPPRPAGTQEWLQWALSSDHSVYSKPVWSVFDALTVVWLLGIAAMLLYAIVSYVCLIRRKDSVTTPFVYGFIKPKMYIPGGLAEKELRYVTLHEQTHIKRRDHLVKIFAFALLCVHWFNPFAWLAFVLLCADMEMSCDERVLRELGADAKADYSQTLLSLSMNRRILSASPLAFGEGGIKARVKNALTFKKPSRIIVVAAVSLATVLAVGFSVNRSVSENNNLPDLDLANFSVNGFALGMNINDIDISDLTSDTPLNIRNSYEYNWRDKAENSIRYSADSETNRLTKMSITVAIGGAYIPTASRVDDSGMGYIPYNLRNIEQVKRFFGKGAEGWQDREQKLRYIEYVQKEGRLSASVRFVYAEADGGLIWVIAESNLPTPKPFDLSALSALRTPYVGDNSAVGKIIGFLPPLDAELTHQFFSIGDDYGTGYAPYVLTLYYEQNGGSLERNMTIAPKSAALLFALIDNLQEVNFAFRNTLSGGVLDKAAYTSRFAVSRENIAEFIGNLGLTWEDFQNDFEMAATLVFAQSKPVDATDESGVAFTPDDAMYKRAALDAIVGAFVFDDSGVNFEIPAELTFLPVKIEIEIAGVEEGVGDGNFEILTGWSVDGDEITNGAKFSVPLWNIGGKGAHLKLTFADGDTIYYSPLYQDWQNSVKNPSDSPMPASELYVPVWTPIEDLPLDYGKDAAVADGVYVNIHGSEIHNQKMIDMFYESVFSENPAMIRTMEYTVEGDPVITDYWFGGDSFTVITDMRRDKFGAQEIFAREYLYLVPLDRSRPAGTLKTFFLSNEQNIYASTGDDGVTLIDDLALIPSPSDSVAMP